MNTGHARDLLSTESTTESGGTRTSFDAQPDGAAARATWPTLSRYEILAELGHGGMGVVYKARERQTGQLVALKVMRRPGSEALARFKREFRALQEVSHPNLVALYDAVSEGGEWFFTMELLEGTDLLRYVREQDWGRPGPMETEDALSPAHLARLRSAVHQLAEGLVALHAAGKVHRDIKPSNILITRDGQVKLLDFGLTADVSSEGLHQSTVHHVVGTVAYMSPEQCNAQPVSTASDWYSVGVVLYEALTGKLPFQGSVTQILMAKTNSEACPPNAVARDVPDDLNALCVDLMRRSPEARPKDMEVLARLAEHPQELPPSQPPRLGSVLVGRERYLAALEEALGAVRRGAAVFTTIHGSSGVGKTALVRHFLDRVGQEGGAVVLEGRCYEREAIPYKALDSVIDVLSRYLCRPEAHAERLLPRDVWPLALAFPVLQNVPAIAPAARRRFAQADPRDLRRRAFGALREMLARLGDYQPVVVWIDDLQWGDLDSAQLLSDLMAPPDPPRLLVLVCYRDEDAGSSSVLRAFLRAEPGGGREETRRDLQVEPLRHHEALALALGFPGADAVSPGRLDAIARESGGNPFFVGELVRSVSSGVLPKAGEITLDGLVQARVALLPEGQRRLLDVVAVSGRPIGQGIAFCAAGLPADTGEAAVNRLRAERLVRTAEGKIETYHDRIREALVAGLSSQELLDHHCQLANLLQAAGADPEVLAVHYEGARQPEKAAEYYAQAADQAADALAFDRAARLYRRALEGRAAGAERCRLRTRLGAALANAGRARTPWPGCHAVPDERPRRQRDRCRPGRAVGNRHDVPRDPTACACDAGASSRPVVASRNPFPAAASGASPG
jgi:tRNA A-37 threonylcarbamoyl transferase component Bud32